MEISAEQFTPRDVVYTRRTGPYRQSAPEAWTALWTWLNEKGLAENTKRMIGFGLDNPVATAPEQMRYEACVELHGTPVADEEAGMKVQTIPGGWYAVYRMEGSYHRMSDCFQDLRNTVLPEKGLFIDPSRPFLEIYVNANVPEDELLTDLCIPIES